jgi:hypothetical protein
VTEGKWRYRPSQGTEAALEVNDRVEEIDGPGRMPYRPASGERVTAPFAPRVPTVVQRVVAAAGGQADRSGSGEVSKPWW